MCKFNIKKYILITISLVILIGCGGGGSNSTSDTISSPEGEILQVSNFEGKFRGILYKNSDTCGDNLSKEQFQATYNLSFQSGTAGGNIFSWYTVDDANDLYYSSVAIGPDANPGVLSRAGITNREGELIVDFDPRVLNHFVGQNDCTENITMSIVPLTKDEDGSASMLSIVRTSYLSCENSHGQICTIEYSGVIEK